MFLYLQVYLLRGNIEWGNEEGKTVKNVFFCKTPVIKKNTSSFKKILKSILYVKVVQLMEQMLVDPKMASE